MNILQRLFGKKQEPKQQQKRNYSTGYSGSNYSKRKDDSMDLTNPLNPLSPFWIGNNNNDNYTPPVQDTPSTDFGGASGSWDDNSSSNHSSGSSYDSGSSSSYDSGSSSSDSSSSSSDSGSSSCD
jgi:cytoskeletal protein RodZ